MRLLWSIFILPLRITGMMLRRSYQMFRRYAIPRHQGRSHRTQIIVGSMTSALLLGCCAISAAIGANTSAVTTSSQQADSGDVVSSDNGSTDDATQFLTVTPATTSLATVPPVLNAATPVQGKTPIIVAPTATVRTAATAIPQPTQPVVYPTATKPAPPPTATSVPHLFIQKIAAYATDYSFGEVEVRTLPGTTLAITVTYCSGYSATSHSLQGIFLANSQGYQTWMWTPETKCRGPADANITASWNGQATSADFSFTVS